MVPSSACQNPLANTRKTFLTSSPEGQRIARDFNLGILVMLFAPYVVFGSFAAFAFRSQIRERIVRLAPRLFR